MNPQEKQLYQLLSKLKRVRSSTERVVRFEHPQNSTTDPSNSTTDPSNSTTDPSNSTTDPSNSTTDPSVADFVNSQLEQLHLLIIEQINILAKIESKYPYPNPDPTNGKYQIPCWYHGIEMFYDSELILRIYKLFRNRLEFSILLCMHCSNYKGSGCRYDHNDTFTIRATFGLEELIAKHSSENVLETILLSDDSNSFVDILMDTIRSSIKSETLALLLIDKTPKALYNISSQLLTLELYTRAYRMHPSCAHLIPSNILAQIKPIGSNTKAALRTDD
jgi:hypothetical protein